MNAFSVRVSASLTAHRREDNSIDKLTKCVTNIDAGLIYYMPCYSCGVLSARTVFTESHTRVHAMFAFLI